MRILHTNDFHGKLNDSRLERLSRLRKSVDFYFDCGDSIKSGNMGFPIGEDPVWSKLKALDCTAGVTGNREFHITEQGFRAKIAGCSHPLLVANLVYKEPTGEHMQTYQPNTFSLSADRPLASGMLIGDVGVFGVMVPMVTDSMSARHISAFLNTSPQDAAAQCVERLRGSARSIICISHIGLRNDVELAAKVPGIDLIVGGHSHDVVDPPAKIGETWIAQAGSHGRFAGVLDISREGLKATYEPLP